MLNFLETHIEAIKIAGFILVIILVIALIISSHNDLEENIKLFTEKYGFQRFDEASKQAGVSEVIKKSSHYSKRWSATYPILQGDGESIFRMVSTNSNSYHHLAAYWSRTQAADVIIQRCAFNIHEIVVDGLEEYYFSAKDEAAARETAGKLRDFLKRHEFRYEIEISNGNLIVVEDQWPPSLEDFESLLQAGRETRALLAGEGK
jgi:hypothetical protein